MATNGTIVRSRADWIGVLEAAYQSAGSDESWAKNVLDAASGVFQSRDTLGMQIVQHDAECESGNVLVALGMDGPGEPLSVASQDLDVLGHAGFRTFFYPPAMVTTQTEIEPLLQRDVRERMVAMRRAAEVSDMIGVVVHPEPGTALVISCGLDKRTKPTLRERALLGRVGLHLESAYRLRLRPESVKATLSLDGHVTERSDDSAPDSATLAHGARQIEASLSHRGRSSAETSLDVWTALVDGRYSLVRRGRTYLVLENARSAQDVRALTQREIEVLSMAARGMPTKMVSYGLGLSPSRVSAALARATSKLGLATHLELLRLAATIGRDPRSHALPETITAAEAEVLQLLREGLSNREIARLRSRSVRTVANQVASLLRKTGSATRRALVTTASPTCSP